MTYTIGIAGLASFYGPAYAERLSNIPGVTIDRVFADRGGDSLTALGRPTVNEFMETYNCSRVSSFNSVLDGLDAVVVATPTTRRAEDIITAIQTGVPVLVAKPAATSADEAKDVASASTCHGTSVVMTTTARFDDAIQELATRVHDGEIGNVQRVSASIRHDRVPENGIDSNAEHAPSEAGAAYAMSVYTADTLNWLVDAQPVRVFAEYANVNTPHSTHPDIGVGTVRFTGGTVGNMTMTYSTDCRESLGNWEIEVVGSDGIIRTAHDGYEGLLWTAGPPSERTQLSFGRTASPVLDRQVQSFIQVLEGDWPKFVPGPDEVADALALCEYWERAAKTHEPVYIPTE